MKRQGTKRHMDGLLMLLLFGVFAVCVLIVLLTGARAYRGLTDRDRAAVDRRNCAQRIMPLEGLSFAEKGGFVTAELQLGEGAADTLCLSLRSEEGGRT